jgi:hypothetical protein
MVNCESIILRYENNQVEEMKNRNYERRKDDEQITTTDFCSEDQYAYNHISSCTRSSVTITEKSVKNQNFDFLL